ncbi:hypothetical protein [Streptomyces sp. NPDC015125]|uniref:hypothetical protein n=1 Tax=Streptomyces sp. NPDC015125 TaxID=3364938 RepID=UPI0037035E0B
MSVQPPAEVVDAAWAIGADATQILIAAAVWLSDAHSDGDDILSTSQIETIERLRPLAAGASVEDLVACNAWDVLSIATTAVELSDRHQPANAQWEAAIVRARAYVDVDEDGD